MLPDSCYTLKSTTATIPQGGVKSDDITIEFSKLDDIKGNRVCVLPVKAQSNDIELVQSQKVFYYVFKAGALINVVADIEQKLLKRLIGRTQVS